MKRFILCSLSATMAVALGSVARAAETTTMSEAQVENNLLAQSVEDSYDSEGEVRRFEYRSPNLVRGVLSPNSQGPNNRAIPTTTDSDLAEEMRYGDSGDDANRYDPSYDNRMEMDTQADEQDYPTEGTILSPDDQGPNNRAEPTPGPADNNRMEMDNQMDERDYPTEGTILSPDDQGPNNRAEPTPGPADNNRMEMNNQTDDGNYPTEGTILSPDDQGPNNRANPTPNR